MAVANCLTTGISVDCSKSCCGGGVNRIWLAKLEDIDSISRAADDSVDGITMVGVTTFFEIVPLEFTSNFNQSVTVENNAVSNDITIDFTLPCPDDDLRERLQEILNCCCGMALAVEMIEGTTWIVVAKTLTALDLKWGKVKPRSMEFTSGAALADANQFVVTLGAFSNKLAVESTVAIPV